jgi:5,10-methylenetetrahydromethanopterin reductase
VELSCAFATSLETPDHIAIAEKLGYRRAWCYDSPGLYPDVWMILSRAAEGTSTIGLGPGVLVPSLRHPMVNAAAIATLNAQAPGRLAVAVGAGFTGRMVLGQRPLSWSYVADYVRTLRALLRGEEADWRGARLRMLHPAGFGGPPPIDVPILIGADGPKGLAVAKELGDGVFSAALPQPNAVGISPWRALLVFGTVLDDGEEPTSDRALQAAGAALAVVYHGTYERGSADAVDGLPGGRAWREAVESVPVESRHLAVHDGHLIAPNERDRLALGDAAPLLTSFTFTGTVAELRDRVASLADVGVTELVFQPAGPDIRRELEAFAGVAAG